MGTVDITHTVSAKEADGRRLMKELVGGRVFWADEPSIIEVDPANDMKVAPKKTKAKKTKAKKHTEGD